MRDQTEIELIRAPDDPEENAPEFQEELRAFGDSLRLNNVKFSPRGMAFDSIDAIGYQLPEFVVTLGQQVIPAVAVVCAAWVHARSGRKLRLKIGDMKAEGQTVEEIENLLRQAAEFRDRK